MGSSDWSLGGSNPLPSACKADALPIAPKPLDKNVEDRKQEVGEHPDRHQVCPFVVLSNRDVGIRWGCGVIESVSCIFEWSSTSGRVPLRYLHPEPELHKAVRVQTFNFNPLRVSGLNGRTQVSHSFGSFLCLLVGNLSLNHLFGEFRVGHCGSFHAAPV